MAIYTNTPLQVLTCADQHGPPGIMTSSSWSRRSIRGEERPQSKTRVRCSNRISHVRSPRWDRSMGETCQPGSCSVCDVADTCSARGEAPPGRARSPSEALRTLQHWSWGWWCSWPLWSTRCVPPAPPRLGGCFRLAHARRSGRWLGVSGWGWWRGTRTSLPSWRRCCFPWNSRAGSSTFQAFEMSPCSRWYSAWWCPRPDSTWNWDRPWPWRCSLSNRGTRTSCPWPWPRTWHFHRRDRAPG